MEVDVCSIEPVAAFCSSDEENENTGCLQFLPIAPEVSFWYSFLRDFCYFGIIDRGS